MRESEGVLDRVGERRRVVHALPRVDGLFGGGRVVMFLAGDTTYAALLLLLGFIVGAALWKREAA